MDADSADDWFSDDENQPRIYHDSSLGTQPAYHATAPRRSQLRPARNQLPFVPYVDWIPGESYIEQPPTCIHYILEWKFTFKNRSIAKQTEEELVVAPSDFWNEELLSKVEEIAKSKPCKPGSTTVVMSVNDRSEPNITKRFKELGIDWLIVEKQLHAWSHLLRIGKRLKINVSFDYVESDRTTGTTGRGVTSARLADQEIRSNAEQAVLDVPASWKHVFRVMKCPGPPCDRGPYCWQDLGTKRHYKLLGHHLRTLVRLVQGGGKLDTHDDVPEDIRTQLVAEEQQHANRKRKRQDSCSEPAGRLAPMIINNYIPAYAGQTMADGSRGSTPSLSDGSSSRSSSFSVPGPRDDAVEAYCRWQCSKVSRTEPKRRYELARDLSLERGLDLELLHEDNDAQFYIDHGVLEGVARRWVRDIEAFVDQYIIAL